MSYREPTDQVAVAPQPLSRHAPANPILSAHASVVSDDASASPFSPLALKQLQHSLDRYLESFDADDSPLRAALNRLCTEAHAHHLGPETMLVAVKSVWAELALHHPLDEGRKGTAFERILAACLDAYYGAK